MEVANKLLLKIVLLASLTIARSQAEEVKFGPCTNHGEYKSIFRNPKFFPHRNLPPAAGHSVSVVGMQSYQRIFLNFSGGNYRHLLNKCY